MTEFAPFYQKQINCFDHPHNIDRRARKEARAMTAKFSIAARPHLQAQQRFCAHLLSVITPLKTSHVSKTT